jgi:hypothetical protein
MELLSLCYMLRSKVGGGAVPTTFFFLCKQHVNERDQYLFTHIHLERNQV